jgi:hypothetical protein
VNGRAYYEPSSHGMEARFSERARVIREILHPETNGGQDGGTDGGTAERTGEAGQAAQPDSGGQK